MVIRVEHEIHERRKGRNTWVGLLLLGVVGIVFGLTVVKVLNLNEIKQFERFDHVARPALEAATEVGSESSTQEGVSQ